MQHIPEILKIIEGGLKNNSTQVASYAALLAEKLEKEGLNRQAENIRKKLGAAIGNQDFAATSLNSSLTPLPIDRDSRLSLGDEKWPSLENCKVRFSDQVQSNIEEFLIFIEQSHILDEAGVGITPSMLIYGPPGCGKTQLANYIAARLKLPLITARCDTLISSFLGSTAKNIRSLFDHAASRPCVLFLDEFDAFAKARDDQHELGELKRVVVSLLQNIDNLPSNTILIAATNHEDLLDPAVWRRFAYRVQIPLPDKALRLILIDQFLGTYKPVNVRAIADITENMNGAIIEQACLASIRNSVLKKQDIINTDELVIKLIQAQYANVLNTDRDISEKIIQLRSINPKLFTLSRLASLFNISIGKVSKITTDNKEG